MTGRHRAAAVAATALVTGIGGPAGHAAAVALRAAGYRVIGTDMRPVDGPADEFVLVPPATDAGFLPRIEALLADRVGWIVPTVAEELAAVADIAPRWRARGVAVFLPDAAATAICGDKWRSCRHLGAAGVAVPPSAIGLSAAEAGRRLGYPVLSKPRVGRGGRGVVVHDGPDGDTRLLDAIWQAFLPGTEYDVVLLPDRDRPARPRVLAVLEKARLREGRTGNAVAVRRVVARDVAALAIAAARALDLSGPLDIDIRRDIAGVPHVLEINTRIGAHALAVPELFQVLVALHRSGELG